MSIKEKIVYLFFEKKLRQKEIVKELGVSKYIVSRTLSKDSRYKEEKQKRVKEQELIHKEKTKQYIYSKREKEYAVSARLKQEHIQASIELSKAKTINNRAFRKWNSSIYKLNPKKKYYELDKKVTVSYDVPKIIK